VAASADPAGTAVSAGETRTRSGRIVPPLHAATGPRPGCPTDLVQAVVEVIARGELDSELGVLSAVITQRARLLATAQAVTTLANLRVGDRVRINHHAKPNG
jgi:hypothetical protein